MTPQTRQSPGREQDAPRARQEILEAAAAVFARHGFASATMDAIAQEAGYAVASIYNHFEGGKRDLYRAVVEAIAADFDETHDLPPISGLTFRQALELLLYRQFELVERHRDFIATFFAQRASVEWWALEDEAGVGRDIYRRGIARFAALIERGVEAGEVRCGDPVDYAVFVTGVVNAVVFRWLAGDLGRPLRGEVPCVVDLLLTGIGAPAGGPA